MLELRDLAEPREQFVAGDREQIRTKRGLRAELVAGLVDTRQERLLRQIIGFAQDLMLEESIDLVEVARTQLLPRAPVTVTPALQQDKVVIRVIIHRGSVSRLARLHPRLRTFFATLRSRTAPAPGDDFAISRDA